MLNLSAHSVIVNSPVRRLKARVEMYTGSTLASTFSYLDALKSFSVERVGEGKFFGYGICQKVNIKLRDINREIEVSTANSFKVQFGEGNTYNTCFPIFYVTEVNRDETSGELSITGYDALNQAALHTVEELDLIYRDGDGEIASKNYTMRQFASDCADVLGLSNINVYTYNVDDDIFELVYYNGANFDGTENLREALNAVAEATQTIYYLNEKNILSFKRLDKDGDAALNITKSEYYTLKSRTSRRLGTIAHVTELGNNMSVSTTVTGSTQYVRDNPFWDILDDEILATRLNMALEAAGGLSINQFECNWRGNYLLEIGDKIAITQRDGKSCASYLLDDRLTYDGSLLQVTKWSYTDNEEETVTNPINLGDAVKKTYAKVDKLNQVIDLVSSTVGEFDERIAQIEITTEGVTTSVTEMQEITGELEGTVGDLEAQVGTLTQKVSQTITAEEMKIEVEKAVEGLGTSVTTETGFTFNADGLTVSKSGTEMTTRVTENGMTIRRGADEVLVANNVGVRATNLHATTYLIIGNYSRFEDYRNAEGENRTGCFWIGEEATI